LNNHEISNAIDAPESSFAINSIGRSLRSRTP